MAEVHVPDNEFTRMIGRVAAQNQGGFVEAPVNAGPLPNARSAALGVVPDLPLSAEERAELDAKAMALGIMPQSEEAEGTNYATREEAEAAGAPVERPREPITPSPDPASLYQRPGNVISSFPRLPDFSKPAVLDLGRGVIYLDGLEFPIPEADLAEFRAFAITAVHTDLMGRLNAALAQYVPAKQEETADAGAAAREEEVRPLLEGEAPGSLQSEDVG